MKFPYEEYGFDQIRTYPLRSRRSKARVEDFARPYAPGAGVAALVDRLPRLLAGVDFRRVVDANSLTLGVTRQASSGDSAHTSSRPGCRPSSST